MKTTALLLAIAFAAPAAAQDPEPDVIEHTFDDADDVEGDRSTASGINIVGRRRLPRHSLIRPRTQFIDQLMKSVEDM